MIRPVVRIALFTAGAILIISSAARPSLAGEPEPGSTDAQEPGVLRYRSIEIKPDIKFYSDYQIDLSDEELANAFHVTRAYLGMKLEVTPWLSFIT